MFKKIWLILFATIVCSLSIVTAVGEEKPEFEDTITRIYDSWDEITDEFLEYNNITYQLKKEELIDKTLKIVATYYVPKTITKTFYSYEDAKNDLNTIKDNNNTYVFSNIKKSPYTKKVFVTYELQLN